MPRPRALSWSRDRLVASLPWSRPLGLTAAAVLLLQLGGLPPAVGAGPAPAGQRGGRTPADPGAVLASDSSQADVTQGALRVTRGDQVVECPLRHTDVRAEVSGFIGRVRVTQTFENPYDEAIEAVYVFPLPHRAAVDEMSMVVGERRIAGVMKRRLEAREAYARAIASGHTAALLEQERPNVFTQTVGNIAPRQQVRVEIAYVDVLPYEGGRYEFHFPMVVGPRYIPGAPTGHAGPGWAPDTTQVPDASRITPPVLKPGFRTGHDVRLTLALDAGVPVRELRVHNHQARVQRAGAARATVTLSARDSIPNKDFVLSYHVDGERPRTAVLSHAVPGDDGYFLLMLQPREMDEALRASPPRDVCFLIDVSGSMSGKPITKVTDAMERFFDRMRPQDRLQVVTFAGASTRLFPGYVPASSENVEQALALTRRMEGQGGTEMLAGIRAVLADPVEPDRVRIVVMLTDGFIGNEDAIIREVGRRGGDQVRFWTVGIGSSPNRHLLDGVARQGGGASAVLGLGDDPAPLVGGIMDRIQRAQLSRVALDWGGLDVFETYPVRMGELWAGRPVFLLGRYRGQGQARVTLSGLAEGEPVSFEVPVSLADPSRGGGAHAVLAAAWARRKIEHLGDQMAVAGESREMVEEVTELALRYRLMSAYTSFVAVDESQALESGEPPLRTIVPVPMPEGVSYEGVFGADALSEETKEVDAPGYVAASKMALPRQRRRADAGGTYRLAPGRVGGEVRNESAAGVAGFSLGVEGGVPGGVVGGVVGGLPAAPPSFAAPVEMQMVRDAEARHRPRPDDERVAEHRRRAQAARAEAARMSKAGDLDGAARELALAAVSEGVRARLAGYDDGTLASVLAELNAANAAREERVVRDRPRLGERLNLVIRNAGVASALQTLAGAAGVTVQVAPGSMDAAAAAFGPRALRVAWMDLRGVTAARALTLATQPAGLAWTLEDGVIRVRPGAWASDPRLSTTAGASSPGDERRAREAMRAKRDVAVWTWRLLAAALERRVDGEAVSQLLEAWSVPGVGAPDALTLRSLWAISVARGVNGSDPVLSRLWQTALASARPVVAPAPGATLASEAALYGMLLRSTAPEALPLSDPGFAAGSLHDAIARALRAPGAPARGGEIVDALATGRQPGDDGLVLAGVALRHQGGDGWKRFRDRSAELARATRASGAALLVVNHLEGGVGRRP